MRRDTAAPALGAAAVCSGPSVHPQDGVRVRRPAV